MARRNTKADRLLNNSAMRLEAARMRARLAQSELNTAIAVREAAQVAYDELVGELTPQPRDASKKPATAATAPKEPQADKVVSDARCIAMVPTLDVPCGEREDALIHDPKGGYASYHEFEPPKSVARVPRKLKLKTDAPAEIGKDDALGVGASAGD